MNISGLSTDIFFIAAIKTNEDLMDMLPAHDVYDNVANPDEDMDNVPLPYIIVNNDGGQNIAESKDDEYESPDDQVNISIRIVACNRDQLDTIVSEVRKTIHSCVCDTTIITTANASTDSDDEPEDVTPLAPYQYDLSFSDISFSPDKPCHQIMLYYACQVANDLFNEDEENDEQEIIL
jgi:hypothetical protein